MRVSVGRALLFLRGISRYDLGTVELELWKALPGFEEESSLCGETVRNYLLCSAHDIVSPKYL